MRVPQLVALATYALLTGSRAEASQQVVSPPKPASSAQYAGAIAKARVLVRDSMAGGQVPGMSVAVAIDGKVVWSEGFGLADVENGVRVTPSTKLRIGSVSKPITAAAVALLVQQGKLDLDSNVQRYVPSFPVKRHPVTPRQLAGHLGGVRHYAGDEMMSMRPYANVTDGLAMFRDDSLVYTPGTRYSYSSHGFNLLSAVVEGASGEPFLVFVRRNVLRPLGMSSTIAEHQDSVIEHRARYYVRATNGPLLNAPYVDNSYKWAGGGFISTPEDLVRFGSAMLRKGFLDDQSRALLFTSQRTADGKETGYGIGWSVGTDSVLGRTIAHGGGSVGANAYLIMYPDRGIVVAMLANTNSPFVGSGRGARQVARLFAR
ncbi:MAG: beta-lactamase family protein [Anaerolineae bacterium]|nr:beta-lactamase family protein [Gemmatimonadaceae bacterium]